MTDSVLVTIRNSQRIPFINRSGPISSPISIARDIAEKLKAMGFAVVIHEPKEGQTVSVNPATGVRTIVSEEDFVAHNPETHGSLEVQSEPPLAAVEAIIHETVVVPKAPVEVENVAQPEENVVEETNEEDEEETTEEDATEAETDEETSIELDIYDMEHYADWTKAQLASYLRNAKAILPDDIAATIASSNKKQLLDIVQKYIVDAD